MKLRRLTIHNIASIADATIDFDSAPLVDAGIFLITGPTGAGKTTLLDAICVALYDAAPRFRKAPGEAVAGEYGSEIKASDARNMLRRGTGEGFVELTFLGSNGIDYKATWQVRRARNKPGGTLQDSSRTLERLADGTLKTRKREVEEEITEAVGLTYEQFLRTVMLPQGEFTRFLKADDRDKAALLEKITRVDIYSRIGSAIFERARSHTAAWQHARELADATPLLTAEAEAEMKRNLAVTEAEALVCRKEAERLRGLLTLMNRRDETERLVGSARNTLDEATAASGDERVAERRRIAERWEATVEVRNAMAASDKAYGTYRSAVAELAGLKCSVEYHRTDTSKSQETLSALGAQVADLERRTAVTPERRRLLSRSGDIRHHLLSLADTEKSILAAQDTVRKLMSERDEHAVRLAAAVTVAATATHEAEVCEAVYATLKDSVDRFAKTMRATLTAGCACPVCRQKVTTLPPAEAIIEEEARRARENWHNAKLKADTKLKEKMRIEAALTEIDRRSLPASKKNVNELVASRDKLKATLASLWEFTGSNEAALEEAGRLCVENDELVRLDRELVAARGQLRLLEHKVAEASDALAAISATMKGVELPEDAARARTVMPLNDLALRVARLGESIAASLVARDENEAVVRRFLGSKGCDYTREELVTLSGYKSADISRWRDEAARLGMRLASARKALAERLLDLRRIRREVVKVGEIDRPGVDSELVKAEAAVEDHRNTVAAINASLAQNEVNRELAHQRNAEAARLREVANRWEGLNSLFGSADGAKMRRIAQSLILTSLVEGANSYMATLAPRYRLRVAPGSFTILVEDSWQGYASRPVSTVSGGESFLVSLALALALSDIGSTFRVDTLFIDEGFGSLSADVLETAMATLSALRRRANRRVGIISHVAGLADRIPVRIEVSRAGQGAPAEVRVL